MVEPRTEALAEAGNLTVVMGGESFRLSVLTIEQSEDWQRVVGSEVASLEDGIDDNDEDERAIAATLARGGRAMTDVLVAYDHRSHSEDEEKAGCADCVLGGHDNVRKHMTQRELHAAVNVVMEAEFPFDKEARRSVVEAFGLPLRVLGLVSSTVMAEASQRVKSPSSLSPVGASPTPTSVGNGRTSKSSSAGPTASVGSPKRSKRVK